ncbi:MAG: peptidoglycan-binding protein [Myxococcales bacterium]|nr:peptidoglycan-binding protein [Myxococcales bacterium]
MPALPAAFASLVAAAALPLDDFAAQALHDLPRPGLLAVVRQAAELLGDGVGALLLELGVARAAIRAPMTVADLRAPALAQVRAGRKVVDRADRDRARVQLVQRALQAVAARVADAPAELRLTSWGSDGAFGAEAATAVAALQRWRGLPVTGGFGRAELTAIETLLAGLPVPDLWSADHPITALGKGARRIATIARAICAATSAAPFATRVDGVRYTAHAQQFGVAPTPGTLRLPGGVGYHLAGAGYWKCNVFGGAVIALADLPVPTFQAGTYRHFPRAERFGEALARKTGWQLVSHLDHRDPADPQRALASAANDRAIARLLGLVRPGDLMFVDHPGPPGDDGGHTRVCTRAARTSDTDRAPMFAQARHDQAREERDGLAELAGGRETQFWLLRTRL